MEWFIHRAIYKQDNHSRNNNKSKKIHPEHITSMDVEVIKLRSIKELAIRDWVIAKARMEK